MTESEFISKYNNVSTGLFKTGQNRGINSDKMRTFATDLAALFGVDNITKAVGKVGHALSVGDVVTLDGSGEYVKVTNPSTETFVGIVIEILDVNNFRIVVSGYVSGLSGLTPGSLHYSDSSGAITTTPSSMPVLIALTSSTGLVKNALGGGGSTPVFASDVTFVLSGGKSFGKYEDGETAPWTGLTAIEAIIDASSEYLSPVFTSFTISGQATTVEVGTTLSGSKTFLWAITLNSGTVADIDIYNLTLASTLLAATANDGTQSVTITSALLNTPGAVQQWGGIGNDTGGGPATFYSSTFTVRAWYYRFYGPISSSPADSAAVRALPSSSFHTGSSTFSLNTGTTETKFVVALPPGITIVSVLDITALSANITSEYVLTGTVNVLDAGGTNRAYNIYEMNVGVAYGTSHNHSITTT